MSPPPTASSSVGVPLGWRPPVLDRSTTEGYLARLGLSKIPAPTTASLCELHGRHVERVPYETVWLHLGHRWGIDPVTSARRIASGGGGYCFHLNGAFSALLSTLGFDVLWHPGGVQSGGRPPAGATGDHLVLTVHGLVADEAPDAVWYADVGLGEGPHQPIPLADGTVDQGGFRYRLRRSEAQDADWRLENDPRAGFDGMDFAGRPDGPGRFQARHGWLSTSPESAFTRLVTVQRRTATEMVALRGCVC